MAASPRACTSKSPNPVSFPKPPQNYADQMVKGLLTGLGGRMFGHVCKDEGKCNIRSDMHNLTNKITGYGLVDSQVESFKDRIMSLCKFMRTVYLPGKAKQSSAAQRKILLSHVDTALNNIQEMSNAVKSSPLTIEVFVIATSMHLLLLQELAIIETEPNSKCRWKMEIKNHARKAVDVLKESYKKLLHQRTNHITDVQVEKDPIAELSGASSEANMEIPNKVCTVTWADNFTTESFRETSEEVSGKWSNGKPEELKAKSKYKRAEHILQVFKTMQNDFKIVHNTITICSLLVQNPLPK